MSQAATETNPTETPAPEAPQPTETPEQPTPAVEDPADDKDPRVQRANREAAKYRTERNALQSQLDELQAAAEKRDATLDALRKALTGEDGTPGEDPAEVASRLTGEVDSLRAENTSLRHQLTVHALAGKAGADPSALLDSLTFTKSLDALDASAEDYHDAVAELIGKAVESNKNLRASQGPGRGGAPEAGRAGDSTVTPEQFARMGYAERVELFNSNPTLYRQLAG